MEGAGGVVDPPAPAVPAPVLLGAGAGVGAGVELVDAVLPLNLGTITDINIITRINTTTPIIPNLIYFLV